MNHYQKRVRVLKRAAIIVFTAFVLALALALVSHVRASGASCHCTSRFADDGEQVLKEKIGQLDLVRTVVLSSDGRRSGLMHRLFNHRLFSQPCVIYARVEYCHIQMINQTPVTICYWVNRTIPGVYDPMANCCRASLVELGGRSVCLPPGSSIAIGPIYDLK